MKLLSVEGIILNVNGFIFVWSSSNVANGFRLGEGGDFHHPETSGLMRRTNI
jgi:hypothetical protein